MQLTRPVTSYMTTVDTTYLYIYEACPESKCTEFFEDYKNFNLNKKITWLHWYICKLFFNIVTIPLNAGGESGY